MAYLDTITEKKLAAAQQAKQQNELNSMLSELKKMQLASLMGSQGKSTVILTDQTDLGDKLAAMNDKVVAAIAKLDSTTHDAAEISGLQDLKDGLAKLTAAVINKKDDDSAVIAAIKALKLSTVVNVPDQPAPKVTVQERSINFQPIIDAIHDSKAEETAEQDDKLDLEDYRAQDLTETDDKQYVGFVNPSGNWYIIENDIRANKMRYVFGTTGYAAAFKQASSYQYQLLNEAINATA